MRSKRRPRDISDEPLEKVTLRVESLVFGGAGLARMEDGRIVACGDTGVPLLRLARPGWETHPAAGHWHWVPSHDAAAATAAADHGPVFLTTGRQSLDRFVGPLASRTVLVRVVDPVTDPLPPGWTVLLSRGPYEVAQERDLMVTHGVRVLVTKDSGGGHTQGKLDAADGLGLTVVVVRRPTAPAGVEEVGDVPGAVRWLARRAG